MGLFINFLAAPGLYDLPGHRVKAVMLNYPQYCATPELMSGTRSILKAARPEFVFMDSGGFQKLQAEIKNARPSGNGPISRGEEIILNLTPETIVEGAVELRPTAMMALDSPIQKIPDHGEREREFRRKVEINVRWAIETSELVMKRCPEVGLFIPVQCYTLQHLDEFLEAIKGIHLTGLSLPIRGMSLLEVTLFLLRFHQAGIKNVHLLGVGAFLPMALAAYFARHFFEWVSLDATTWKEEAIHSRWISPHDLTSMKINDRVVIPEDIALDCPCPFCTGKTFSYIKHLPYPDRRILLGCHNYWVTERAAQDLYRNGEGTRSLCEYLAGRTMNRKKVRELSFILKLVDGLRVANVGSRIALRTKPGASAWEEEMFL